MPRQAWPALPKAPATASLTALSMSPSSQTISGSLPPSSMVSFLIPAMLVSLRPTSVLPVNVTMSIFRLETSSFPISPDLPVTTPIMSGGMPLLSRIWT